MGKVDEEKLDWEDIILNMDKPVYDKKLKIWRVLDCYKYMNGKYYIGFSDSNCWEEFDKQKLYLKEKE